MCIRTYTEIQYLPHREHNFVLYKTTPFMLFKQIIGFHWDNNVNHINTLCGKIRALLVLRHMVHIFTTAI